MNEKEIYYEDFLNLFNSIDSENDLKISEKKALISLFSITKTDIAQKLSKFILFELFDRNGRQIRKINERETEILKFCRSFISEDSNTVNYNSIIIEK